VRFTNDLYFLSNFYPCNVTLGKIRFNSVETAYQAAKVTDDHLRFMISEMQPGEAKRFARGCRLRGDWDKVRVEIMRGLVQQKFQDEFLLHKLQKVKLLIVEHNVWHDNFWGSCTCQRCGDRGTNTLGKILMEVRDEAHR